MNIVFFLKDLVQKQIFLKKVTGTYAADDKDNFLKCYIQYFFEVSTP
jgi:hypothetical protein